MQRPIGPVPCPICGAEPRYRTWADLMPINVNIFSRKRKGFLRGSSNLMPLVCTVCGYVQFFVIPEVFRD